MSVGGGGSWCQISDPANFLAVSDKGLRPGSKVSYRVIGDNLWVLGSFGVKRDVWEIPWDYLIGLMSLLMIHKACMPVYK